MGGTLTPARDYITALGDFFLPRTCLVCGRTLLRRERYLCIYCMDDLPRTWFETVEHNPMADRFNEMIQRELTEYEPFSRAAALFYYNAHASYRNIPRHIKYHGGTGAGRMFGRMLGEALAAAPLFAGVTCVLPVPLHPRRRWKRGYNQAEVIARAAAQALGAECACNILSRRRMTRTQTSLTVEQKAANVRSAFVADPVALAALGGTGHLLLVDDVFTTGATLCACRSALRKPLAALGVPPESVRISIATLACVGGL